MKNIALHKYLKIIIVCLFIMLVAVQAGKSFVLDEIDFPIVSHATSQSYKPIYYRGETSPVHVGTYHPTLYINSLAMFIRIFGFSETTVRFFGVVCTLASAYLLILILRTLIKKNEAAETMFLGLFLLNPYTVANTTLPDIDSTILPVLILMFLYFSLKYLIQKKEFTDRVVMILGGLFALALWSKLTTPLIIPFFLIGLTVLTTKDIKRSLIFTLKVSTLGVFVFLITYFAYCKLLGLSPTYTYRFLLDSFTKGTSTDGPLVGAIKNMENIKTFIYWLTLPLATLLGVSVLGVMFNKSQDVKAQVKKLLIFSSVLVTIFYIALISPFGGFFKYPFAVFGLLLLSIIFFYDQYFQNTKIKSLYAFSAIVFGFIIEKLFWGDSMFMNNKPFSGLFILLLIIVACFILINMKVHRTLATLFVLFVCFTIGFQLSITRIQAIKPYPTKYHYGQIGLSETTSYLRANTERDEVIWAMKDVGYYVNNRYRESYTYYFNPSLEADLINMLKDSKVRYYVATGGIGQDNLNYYPNIKSVLETYATKEKQFGDFVIYKSKGAD